MTGQGQGSPPSARVRDAGRRLRGALMRHSIPGFLRRLDRWLLLQHPLVWRTRVHYFVWFSLILGNPLLFAAGWVYPVSRTSVPTAAALDTLVTWLQLLGALILALWTLAQARAPLPELRARDYLVTYGLYAACILMILLNSFVFVWSLVYRIADVTPDQAFTEEYAFHARYNFWCFHPDIDQALVDRHRQAIEDSLRRYGLDGNLSVRPQSYGYDDIIPCLRYDYELLSYNLGAVLSSIQHAKRFRDSDGLYYERYVLSIPVYLVAGVLLSGLMLLSSTNPGIRNRHLGRGEGFRSMWRIRLRRPGFIQRLDRRLLIRRPLLQTTRLHLFLPYLFLVYGTLVLAVLLGGLRLGFGDMHLIEIVERVAEKDLLWVLTLLGLLAIPPAIWGLWQARASLDEPTIGGNQRALLLYYLAAFWPQVLVLFLLWSMDLILGSTHNIIEMIILAGISAFYVVGLVFLGKYLRARLVLIGHLIGLAFWGGLFALMAIGGVSAEAAIVFFALPWIVLVVTSLSMTRFCGPSKTSALLAAICMMSFPLLGVFITLWIADAFGADKTEALETFLVAMVPLFLITAVPSIHVLIRYRYYPKREP